MSEGTKLDFGPPRVVHCKRERIPGAVYIGRPSPWGNPFTHKEFLDAKDSTWKTKVATREEAIEKFREYLMTRPDLIARLPELRGKVLACWCAPSPCHGDVLLEMANK